ncbi:MAG: homocysteine S-methyltransferase family protein [Thermoflexales bacterium]|nr:homocysteine S-methyltransferase family protein [Thermoflexales bacterium]
MDFLTRLTSGPPIVADGAMGTMLQAAGLPPGKTGEFWVLERPDAVMAVHRAYVEAGADLILTCTFGGTRHRLNRIGLTNRVAEVNHRAVEIARQAAAGRALVAGDIGPLGELLAPLGKLSYQEAVDLFAEQAAALAEAGADVLYIETMSALDEARAAVEGARQAAPHLPITLTFSFDTHGRTNMGVRPEQAAKAALEWGVVAFGANCGATLEMTGEALEKMRAAAPDALLIAKPNAGLPRWVEGKPVYDATPEMMADFAARAVALGARIVGGCCGSGPAHIQAIARRMTMAV